jgi:heptose-I-phosphate ethanolaminephosphotransferase
MIRGALNRPRGIAATALTGLADHRRLVLESFVLAALLLAPLVVDLEQGELTRFRASYLLLALPMALLAVVSRPAFVVACALLVPTVLLHQHVERHWGGGQLDARIEAFLESTPTETREYLESHVDGVDGLFVALAAIFVVALLRAARRSHPPARVRVLAAVALVLMLVAAAAENLRGRLASFPPYAMAANALQARERYRLLSDRTQWLERNPLPAAACHSRYDKIVIVFGESAISDHMSIFGYQKPTTPFAVASGAHAFDALAPSNQTRFSMGMMMTAASPGSFDRFYRSHSLVGELRSCGFGTLWISNQGRRGEYDSFSTSLAQEADEQVFLNELSWTESELDGRIVEVLAARDAYRAKRQATFVHLIGSHARYGRRYPEGFGLPGPRDTVAMYDNSILYTDHILSQLYERFADEALLFVYVSDHGQVVSESHFGSGFLPGYQEEYRTPLLIWTDDDEAMGAIRTVLGGARLNLESFDDVMRFLVGLSAEPVVSTSTRVSVLRPEYVRDYRKLASWAAAGR